MLKNRREEMGLTLHQLAAKSGVSYVTIHMMESASRIPSHERLVAVCEVLALDPAEVLFDLSENRGSKK